MLYAVDTSQFIQGWKPSKGDEVVTSYNVLKELDQLKQGRRTKQRQQKQIKLLYDLLEKGTAIVLDVVQPTVDEEVIELGLQFNACIISCDTALIQRQKVVGANVKLFKEELPADQFPPVKYLKVKDDLSGSILNKKLKYPEFTYMFITSGTSSRLGKYVNGVVEYIDKHSIRVRNRKIEPLNGKQTMFVDQLLDDRVEMVCQFGPAGSGKTLLQVQSQLHMIKKGKYDKLIIVQPPVQLGGRDRYGFFPGSLQRKSSMYLGGQIDQIRWLYDEEGEAVVQKQIQNDSKSDIEIQSFQNIRGRSIKRSVVIVDEQQNATPLELKTFITRIDKTSKIVLLGDVEQIDTGDTSIENNGMLYVQSKMYYSDVTQIIELDATQRSKLVEDQLELL